MRRLIVAAIVSALPLGCGADEVSTTDSACAEDHRIGAACAGVPQTRTADLSACNKTHEVDDDAGLAIAIDQSGAGDCIALGAGNYAGFTIASGITVFGTNTDEVVVAGINIESGTVTIADLTVASGTVEVAGNATVILSGTRLRESDDDALRIASGGSATLRHAEIIGAGRYGVSAFDSDSVTIERSIIENSDGPGIWVQCTDGCACSGTVSARIEDSLIRNNRIVGISSVGATLTMSNVLVADTTVGSGFEAGGGISASACSEVTAIDVSILDNADFGMLVDDSSLQLERAKVEANLRGLWVQSVGASTSGAAVTVRQTTFTANRGVSFGVDKASTGVSIESSDISDTKIVQLPVLVNGTSAGLLDVGDGIAWLGGSTMSIQGVTLQGSARAGLLIDGPWAAVAPLPISW